MKLHQREGQAHFIVRDPDSDRVWRVDPVDYLSARAATMLPGEPDQILQFAHYLQARWKADYDLADVQVHADVKLSLNGRSPQPLVDSTLDLTHEHRHLGHYFGGNRFARYMDFVLPGVAHMRQYHVYFFGE